MSLLVVSMGKKKGNHHHSHRDNTRFLYRTDRAHLSLSRVPCLVSLSLSLSQSSEPAVLLRPCSNSRYSCLVFVSSPPLAESHSNDLFSSLFSSES
jgi:hypothetical protein